MERIFLQDQDAKVSVSDGQLIVKRHDVIVGKYPVVPLKEIIVIGNPQITTQAVRTCMAEGIEIQYYSTYGKYAGMMEPVVSGNIRRRLSQYELIADEKRSLEWSRSLLSSKLKSCEVEYRRITDNGWHRKVRRFLPDMERRRHELQDARTKDELRGMEGMAARTWFRFLGESLPGNWSWNGRNSHPPQDEFNALLSFLYVMTAGELDRRIRRRGLDPALSFMHRTGYGTGGLAYDLLELFRSVECEHEALMLVHKRKIVPSDFIKEEKNCFFSGQGREKILEHINGFLKKYREPHEECILKVLDSLQKKDIPDFVSLQKGR